MPEWAVQAPDGKVIQFPDSFTEADVNREMYKMYSAPPGVPRPQVNMQTSLLGLLQGSPDNSPPVSKVPPSIQNAPDWVGEGIAGVTGAGIVGMGGSAALGLAGSIPVIGKYAKPALGSAAIDYARHNLPGGQYIPPYAELAPWLGMGGAATVGATDAAERALSKAPRNAGDPFRDVPDPEADVFREPPPRTAPAPAETQAAAASETTGTADAFRAQNAPYTYSGESALRQVLTGQDNKALLQIAKSRGIDVAKESQLKPGVADTRIIDKIVDDFSEDELSEIRDKYIESTRMGLPSGLGAEAFKTASLQTYFPDLKLPQTRLVRTQKAFAGHLTDLAKQQQ